MAFDDLRSTVSAEEIDKEENDRNDKEKLNQRGSHMEDDECPNPLRNTNLIRFPSELHGITQQSVGVDSQGHIPRRGSSRDLATIIEWDSMGGKKHQHIR